MPEPVRGPAGVIVRLLDVQTREESFDPAYNDLIAAAAANGGTRWRTDFGAAWIALQCLHLQIRAALPGNARRRGSLVRGFARDLRFAFRSLRRQPLFTLLAVVTLALGLGATTAVFTLVNGVLLRPLPFAEPDRLVTITGHGPEGHGASLSVPNFEDWQQRNRVFDSFAGATGWRLTDRTGERAEVVRGQLISGAFFETLGIEPLLGRTIRADETGRGAERVAVLSWGFWQRAFGGDSGAAGQELELGNARYTVIGVMPPTFGYPSAAETDLYLPVGVFASSLPWDDRDSGFGTIALARLADGVTLEAAQADMDRVTAEVDAMVGRPVITAQVHAFTDVYAADVRTPLLVLLVAVAFVMLIAAVNVANLLLTRAEARRREVAMCAALGASRGAILRQHFAESLLLAGAGVLIGLVLAGAGVRVFITRLSDAIPPALAPAIRIDATIVLFAVALAFATSITFALLPSWRGLSRGHWAGALREGGRGGSAGRRALHVRSTLVGAEIALALVLLVGAALMMQSLVQLKRNDSGFAHEGILTARLLPRGADYPDRERWLGFYDRVLEELRAHPGVHEAGASLLVPLVDRSWEVRVLPEEAAWDPFEGESVLFNIATPSFFETMGIPILRGRNFTDADRDGAPLVAIIDETMAQHLWPGQDPIGRRLTFEQTQSVEPVYRTVVGVVPNVRHYELRNAARVQAWVPFQQSLRVWQQSFYIAIRSERNDAAALAPLLRNTVRQIDGEVVISDVRTMDSYVSGEVAVERALTALLGVFGGVALVLAAIGVFGLMSILVATRSREIGIRMAIGAQPRSVLLAMLRDTLILAGAGATIGLVVAGALSRLITSLLFGVSALDARVYLGAAAFLITVAVLASLIPAIRAARLDPMMTLRQEV